MRRSAWLAVVLVIGAACSRAPDEEALSRPSRYTGSEPWTILGVAPGDSKGVIEEKLGKAERVGIEDLRTYRWPDKGVTVTFDARDQASSVHGDRLTAGQEILVAQGMVEADVVARLGKGNRRGHYSPQAVGVIGIGPVERGATLVYRNGGNTVELFFQKDALGGVKLTPSPDR